MFYSEEALIAQAIQNSLVHQKGEENQDAMYKTAVEQAMIDSKKEYDDIDRKERDGEIARLKDNPEELQKKTAEILKKSPTKKLAPVSKLAPVPTGPVPKIEPIRVEPFQIEAIQPKKTEVEQPATSTPEPNAPPSYNPALLEKSPEPKEEKKETDSLFGDDENPAQLENPEKEDDPGDMEKLLEELSIGSEKEEEEAAEPPSPEKQASPKKEGVKADPMLAQISAHNPDEGIAKTEKIISNQPVDNDEFAYFKKTKPVDSNRPKLQEEQEDIDLFGGPAGDSQKNTGLSKKDDSFDFEF